VNINGIVNWRWSAKSGCVLASPPGKSEAAEEQNHDHDDKDEDKHRWIVRAADHGRRSAAGQNFQSGRSKTCRIQPIPSSTEAVSRISRIDTRILLGRLSGIRTTKRRGRVSTS
jgi:hypothetical protein